MSRPRVSCPPSRRHWFEAADRRHATNGPPVRVGDEVPTLCGLVVVAVEVTHGLYAPECRACDSRWRADEGIPQRDRHVPVRRAS
jgi:hypothetical protein